MDVSRVLRQLYVGSRPASTDDIDHLKADYRITAILNLQTDDDLDYWTWTGTALKPGATSWGPEYGEFRSRTSMGRTYGESSPSVWQRWMNCFGLVIPSTSTAISGRPFAHGRHRLPCLETRLESG